MTAKTYLRKNLQKKNCFASCNISRNKKKQSFLKKIAKDDVATSSLPLKKSRNAYYQKLNDFNNQNHNNDGYGVSWVTCLTPTIEMRVLQCEPNITC